MMVILADPAPTDAVDLLEIITAECPLTGTGSPDDVLASISFFRVMHEGFGIPYDVMEIYAYDRIDPDAAIEVS